MNTDGVNNKRQYTKFKRHVNHSGERVDARDINKIQQAQNESEIALNDIRDTQFEERVYTIFNNSYFVNAMFVDYFKSFENVDQERSENIMFDVPEGVLTLQEESMSGRSSSQLIISKFGNEIALNDFILITNQSVPQGASVTYYIEPTEGGMWQIKENMTKTPLHLTMALNHGFRLVAKLECNSMGEKPVINGYAILFFDAQVEENLGMVNPDLQRFPQDRNRL